MIVDLENILPYVRKPGQYLGNEWGVIKKDWEKTLIKMILCFPDKYEIGMSNLGMELLYWIINEREDALCERAYAPDLDMEMFLRRKELSIFSVESKHPIRLFDIIGFTLQYELSYTNVLNMLDLGGIPLSSRDRGNSDPLIIAGGPCTLNPEPISDFIDAFVIGEGEEVIGEILNVWKETRGAGREAVLKHLANIEGIYVPRFYKAISNGSGLLRDFCAIEKDISRTIKKRHIDIGEDRYTPKRSLVPIVSVTHDRLTLEIQRGCKRSCRFCQARTFYYPHRERKIDALVDKTQKALRETGYEEISLSSLSTTDYSKIEELISILMDQYHREKISISLSSIRPGEFSLNLVRQIQKVKKTGLTFAPETASLKIKRIISKEIDNQELFSSIESAYYSGWRKIKLYFMFGLPGEEWSDLEQIVNLVKELKKDYRGLKLNITISPFVPKSHTPFQWSCMNKKSLLEEKKSYLKRYLPASVKSHNIDMSLLECLFARGDRGVGMVLEMAWRLGARFDQWREHFNFEIWERAFKKLQFDYNPYLYNRREKKDIFPWDHIETGIGKERLWKEYEKAFKQITDNR